MKCKWLIRDKADKKAKLLKAKSEEQWSENDKSFMYWYEHNYNKS